MDGCAFKQPVDVFWFGAVAAEQFMRAQDPQISRLGRCRGADEVIDRAVHFGIVQALLGLALKHRLADEGGKDADERFASVSQWRAFAPGPGPQHPLAQVPRSRPGTPRRRQVGCPRGYSPHRCVILQNSIIESIAKLFCSKSGSGEWPRLKKLPAPLFEVLVLSWLIQTRSIFTLRAHCSTATARMF